MAVTTQPKLDAHRVRTDFAYLEELVNGKPVAFLDSAASSQKPRQVLDAMRDFYEHSYANVHRGVYQLAERATAGLRGGATEDSRRSSTRPRAARSSSRATRPRGSISSPTPGVSTNLGPGDLVLVTEAEHHSNFVPWQYVAKRTGAEFRMIPIDETGELDLDALDAIDRDGRVKIVATEPRVERARHGEPRRAARRAGHTSATR